MTLLGRRNECEELDRLVTDVLAGASRALVLRGEAGVGKSALLRYLSDRAAAWRKVTTAGIESEMELAYSGLHQLCAPMLDHLASLPTPQRQALETVFGMSAGPAPDRFLVGLAALTLIAEAAEQQPLLCLVDDAQWLDQGSAQIVGFVARRLHAERVAVVCATRAGSGEDVLAALPELTIAGLRDGDARVLLLNNVHGPLDAAVCDQIIAECHGNPLALLELPRTWNATDLAGGFGLPSTHRVVRKIEQSYARRLAELPSETQLLVLAAAAEPLGDPLLLHRAAETLGLDMAATHPAAEARLLKTGARIEFAHPLARSAAYNSAAAGSRHRVHRALAEATDSESDPDRRAWHRAHAAVAPDEDVAAELARSAERALERGGVAAAAAFLARAAELTPDPVTRGARALEAAEAKFAAGSSATALELLRTAQLSPLEALQRARLERLHAQIEYISSRSRDAPKLLLDAAGRLEPLHAGLARATYLDALAASVYAGRALGERAVREIAAAARTAPHANGGVGAVDLLVDGLAIRFTKGYAEAAPALRRAVAAFIAERQADLSWAWLVSQVAHEIFDDGALYAWADHALRLAREQGALAALPALLDYRAGLHMHTGAFDDAAALIAESHAISEATGSVPFRMVVLALAAWRGEEAETVPEIDEAIRSATDRGEGLGVAIAEYTKAHLYLGLGRYDEALAAALRACEYDDLGLYHWSLADLVEASVRAGRTDVAEDTCRQLVERAAVVATDWALGMSARSQALLSSGDRAETLYRESVERLARTHLATHHARAKLLYGEWLRQENRQADAREPLRAAYDFFDRIGAGGFAGRARRGLVGTGERVRRPGDTMHGELTAQEAQIARLAREGLSNPDIGAQLFISARTVEWHLRKVFTKLGITSRKELRTALPATVAHS